MQRPETGLLAKMWHFPLLEVDQATYMQLLAYWQDQQLTLDAVAEEPAPIFLNFPSFGKRHLGEVTHIFSHLKWHILLFMDAHRRNSL